MDDLLSSDTLGDLSESPQHLRGKYVCFGPNQTIDDKHLPLGRFFDDEFLIDYIKDNYYPLKRYTLL